MNILNEKQYNVLQTIASGDCLSEDIEIFDICDAFDRAAKILRGKKKIGGVKCSLWDVSSSTVDGNSSVSIFEKGNTEGLGLVKIFFNLGTPENKTFIKDSGFEDKKNIHQATRLLLTKIGYDLH